MSPDAAGTGPLLVCVMADGQAAQLVEHGLQLGAHTAWRVLYLDTVASRLASAEVRRDVEQALHAAQAGGAEVVRVSLGVDSATHVVSTIVQQAHNLHAGRILLGNQAIGKRYWANVGERISDFSEVLAASVPRAQIHILVAPRRPAMAARRHNLAPEGTGTLAYWGLPLLVLAACSALSALISRHLHPINLILIFLVGVLYVALRRGLLASVVTVLLSILVFDWVFVEPRWSLKPTDPEYFFTFAVALGVGLAVSRLAAQSRDSTVRALAQAHRAQALSLLAQNLAKTRSMAEIAPTVALAIERAVGARAEVRLGTQPKPDGTLAFELAAGGPSQGLLLVHDLPASHQGAEDLHLLQAFAHQAAVAIERSRYERRSVEAAIETETERVRNTLLAGISHDFRTPLTTIIGAASTVLTQGGQISTAQRDALARHVLDQARRLQSLTSDLLDLARLQEGAVKPECEWCPLDELLQESLAALQPALGERALDVRANSDDIVWCDARLVTQALTNLIQNAAQHSPPDGPIHVSATLGAGEWTLVVRDEGPGLVPGTEREVFKKFYREGSADRARGTGLGLAICEVVARLHGGTISARSEGGAVFEMRFPLPEDDRAALENDHG